MYNNGYNQMQGMQGMQGQGFYGQPQMSLRGHYYPNMPQNNCYPQQACQPCQPCATQCGPIAIPRGTHCTSLCQIKMWSPPVPQIVVRTTCSTTQTCCAPMPCPPC